MVTGRGCLFGHHPMGVHIGTTIGINREVRKHRRFVLHPIFFHACAAEKCTAQVTCWQMPERVYLNFSRYEVEV